MQKFLSWSFLKNPGFTNIFNPSSSPYQGRTPYSGSREMSDRPVTTYSSPYQARTGTNPENTNKASVKKLKSFKKILSSSKGLSLIEMLVVVTIIAFIFSIIGRGISQNRKKANLAQAKILIGVINFGLEEFSYDCGYYPNDLEDLISPPSDCEEWGPEPYLKNGKIPKDPWGQNFSYEYDGDSDTFVILSYGADRKPGGTNKFTKDIRSTDI